MDFKKDELLGIFISIVVATIFFAVLRFDLFSVFIEKYQSSKDEQPEVVMLSKDGDGGTLVRTLADAITARGEITKLIVEDTEVGEGKEVKEGSRVTVDYVGMLQNGTEFDNSEKNGAPYVFTVGAGDVIKGWDAGIVGMKEGGARVLVVPADLAYGNRMVGTIPPNSTLLFSIKLLKVE